MSNSHTIVFYYPIGTTGLIDVETYESSPYAEIPHSPEELAEISYLEACFREDAACLHPAGGGNPDLSR